MKLSLPAWYRRLIDDCTITFATWDRSVFLGQFVRRQHIYVCMYMPFNGIIGLSWRIGFYSNSIQLLAQSLCRSANVCVYFHFRMQFRMGKKLFDNRLPTVYLYLYIIVYWMDQSMGSNKNWRVTDGLWALPIGLNAMGLHFCCCWRDLC